MPEGRWGHARIGNTYATKNYHPEVATPLVSYLEFYVTSGVQRRAGELRQNQTEAEAKLWARLRAHRMAGVQFRRQHAIGNYIVDFCSPRRKLIIELDGSQHLDQADYDLERTKYLQSLRYRVMRFWNNEVLNNTDVVIQAIWEEVNKIP